MLALQIISVLDNLTILHSILLEKLHTFIYDQTTKKSELRTANS